MRPSANDDRYEVSSFWHYSDLTSNHVLPRKHLDELKYPAPRTVSKLQDQVRVVHPVVYHELINFFFAGLHVLSYRSIVEGLNFSRIKVLARSRWLLLVCDLDGI